MELMLNELSTSPQSRDKYQARNKMLRFSKAVSVARQKGFRHIKSDAHEYEMYLSPNYSLKNWLDDREVKLELRSFLFDFIKRPFIRDEDEDVFGQYVDVNYYFENEDVEKTSCIGLAAAHLYGTLTISLASSPTWCSNTLPLILENGGTIEIKDVFNIHDLTSFDDNDLSIFVENLREVVLDKSPIKPSDKKVTLAGDHHGKKELEALSDKLIADKYVCEIRSTNFGGSKFIRKIHADGVIEIVEMKSDSRYALWVQTTGKNYRETKAIADHLRERYS